MSNLAHRSFLIFIYYVLYFKTLHLWKFNSRCAFTTLFFWRGRALNTWLGVCELLCMVGSCAARALGRRTRIFVPQQWEMKEKCVSENTQLSLPLHCLGRPCGSSCGAVVQGSTLCLPCSHGVSVTQPPHPCFNKEPLQNLRDGYLCLGSAQIHFSLTRAPWFDLSSWFIGCPCREPLNSDPPRQRNLWEQHHV